MSTTAMADRHRRWANGPAHVSGLALLAISMATGSGLVVELIDGNGDWVSLFACTLVFGVLGLVLWRGTELPSGGSPGKRAAQSVGVTWLVISLAGSVPYIVSGMMRWDLALFESVSGLTGTGATVLSPIEGNGQGLLFYRQMTQWVGGMGILVLAVAILPFLGVGGMELFRAESAGPQTDQLVPRISQTARRLWSVYCVLTGLAVIGFLLAGTSLYDAVSHAATGVGTGGFSPYNDSIAHFDSIAVEVAAMCAMFLGAVKFTLFYAAFKGRDIRVFWRSSEFRFFVSILVVATAFVTTLNVRDGMGFGRALRDSAFNVISLMSSCGFGTADFTQWVPATQLVLLFLMVTAAMAGSTSGAVKLFRIQVLLKHAWREVRRVRRPSGVFPVRLGSEPVPEDTVRSVLGYVMLYVVIAVAGIVVICLIGADLVTTTGSVMTSMGGIGPGLGEAGPASNFLVFDLPQRLILMFLMLLGRLEIFPLILFLVPTVAAGRRTLKRMVPGEVLARPAPQADDTELPALAGSATDLGREG